MKIGIDIDDIILCTNEFLLKKMNKTFNLKLKFENLRFNYLSKHLGFSYKTELSFFEKLFQSPDFSYLKPLADCVEILNTRNDWDQYFITARPENLRQLTQENFENINLNFDEKKIYLVGQKDKNLSTDSLTKVKLAKRLNLDCFIDDKLITAQLMSNHNIPCFLPNFPWNQNDIENERYIVRVGKLKKPYKFWKEIEKKLPQ